MIDVSINYNGISFYLSCVYGHPNQSLRHDLWHKLEEIKSARNGPWLLVGDFNEILSKDEKIGGREREEKSFEDFQKLYSNCDFQDLKSKSNRFSWIGKRYKYKVKCCLDRVIVNSEFLAMFPASEAEFLGLYGSDHRPVVTKIAYTNTSIKKCFRFDKRLLDIKDFKSYVSNGWNSSNFIRNPTVTNRIRNCRKSMALCRRNSKLNAAKSIEELQTELELNLLLTASDPNIISQIQRELAQAYRDEEKYLQQKKHSKLVTSRRLKYSLLPSLYQNQIFQESNSLGYG